MKAAVALLLVLGAAVVRLQINLDAHVPVAADDQQVLYVRSPAVLRRLALSYDALAADLYWIRTIQYYGSTRLSAETDKRYDLLSPLLELTTSLDPHFTVAYRFGAFFLAEPAPGGADRPDLAIRLLEKGMAVDPRRWEYPYDIGFVYYRRQDYEHAAEWFQRAADVPGAAEWLQPLAAVTLSAGGDIASARRLWQNLLTTADAEWLRTTAARRLQQLDAVEMMDQLESLTAAYERRHGDPPPTWEAMVREGLLRGVPRDPAGFPFVLNPYWGLVSLHEQSPLRPLPAERGR